MKKLLVAALAALLTFTTLSAQASLKPAQDRETDMWGFVNASGQWVIKPQFEDYSGDSFNYLKNYGIVKYKRGWGAINRNGEFVVRPVFVYSATATAAVKEIIANAPLGKWLSPIQDAGTEKWGFVNYLGNWAINPQYDDYSGDSFNYLKDFGVVKYRGKWGIINRSGQFIIKPVFVYSATATTAAKEYISDSPLGKWLSPIQDTQTEKWGFVNYLGNWAILPQYEDYTGDSFNYFKDAAVVKYRGKWGVINKKGQFVSNPVFDYSSGAAGAAKELINSGSFAVVLPSHVANHAEKPTNGINLVSATVPAHQAQPASQADAYLTSSQAAANPASSTHKKVAAPTLKIVSPEPKSKYNSEEITIRYEAKSYDGSPVTISIMIDGRPYDMNTKGVKRASNAITIPIDRREGTRIVALTAKDGNGLPGEPVFIELQYTGDTPKPTLYTLSVGVGQYDDPNITDLMFGAKDARDVAATIKDMKTDLYSRIEDPVVLTDKQATSTNIMSALEDMLDKPRPDDVVIIYMSGHGVEDNRSTYFLSSNTKADRLFSSAVKFSAIEEITNMLTEKQCKVVVFMDTCHAGSMFGTNTKAVNTSLQFAAPSVIGFYSSTSGQKSNEKQEWGNSAFTRALIDGLKGAAADKSNKNHITTRTLENYIFDTVTSLTSNKQQPLLKTEVGHYILF